MIVFHKNAFVRSLGRAGEHNMENLQKMQLFVELQEIEQRGITLWLEGLQSNSAGITDAIFVNEDDLYMRDYIYDKGVLKELRFDKINDF